MCISKDKSAASHTSEKTFDKNIVMLVVDLLLTIYIINQKMWRKKRKETKQVERDKQTKKKNYKERRLVNDEVSHMDKICAPVRLFVIIYNNISPLLVRWFNNFSFDFSFKYAHACGNKMLLFLLLLFNINI